MSKKPQSTTATKQPGSHRERELRSRVNDLEEENRRLRHAVRQADPLESMDREWADLVDRFTQVMFELETLCDPRSSNPIEAQTRYKRADSTRDEGAPTRWARDLRLRIRRALKPLLSEFDRRLEGTYQPPEKTPKVRCTWDGCEDYGKRIPKYVGPRNNPVELSRCPRCDRKLNAA